MHCVPYQKCILVVHHWRKQSQYAYQWERIGCYEESGDPLLEGKTRVWSMQLWSEELASYTWLTEPEWELLELSSSQLPWKSGIQNTRSYIAWDCWLVNWINFNVVLELNIELLVTVQDQSRENYLVILSNGQMMRTTPDVALNNLH